MTAWNKREKQIRERSERETRFRLSERKRAEHEDEIKREAERCWTQRRIQFRDDNSKLFEAEMALNRVARV